jgi:hypothetical protein
VTPDREIARGAGRARAAYLSQLRLALQDALSGYPVVSLEQVEEQLPGFFAEPLPSRVTLSKILQTMGWRKIRVGTALTFASPNPTGAIGTLN